MSDENRIVPVAETATAAAENTEEVGLTENANEIDLQQDSGDETLDVELESDSGADAEIVVATNDDNDAENIIVTLSHQSIDDENAVTQRLSHSGSGSSSKSISSRSSNTSGKLVVSGPPKNLDNDRTNPSPEQKAGLLSSAFFIWVEPLFNVSKAKRKVGGELERTDLWDLLDRDRTAVLSDRFQRGWQVGMNKFLDSPRAQKRAKELEQRGELDMGVLPTENEAWKILKSAIWTTIGWSMVKGGAFKLLNSILQFTFPVVLNLTLTYLDEATTRPIYEGVILVLLFVGAMICRSLAQNQYFHRVVRCGYQLRSSITTAVYRKSLRLSASSRQEKTVGEIVNIMQLDATKMEQFTMNFHMIWDGIFQIIGYLGILYFYIGWPTFVGLGVMLLSIPLNLLLMKKMIGITNSMVKVTDSRVKVTNEALQGIQGVKMAAWEESFNYSIAGLRKKEVSSLRRIVYLRAGIMSFMSAMPAIVASCAITTYALLVADGEVNAAILFTAISVFNQLRFPLMFMPQALAAYVQAKVSATRVGNFLSLEEVDNQETTPEQLAQQEKIKDEGLAIKVEDGEFYWARPTKESPPSVAGKKTSRKKQEVAVELDTAAGASLGGNKYPVLKDINFQVKRNQIHAVIGPVGSGKSSLCSAILNEMHRSHGTVTVAGTVAYAAQTPWILNATLRDNITFGEPFDEKRYWKVLKVCQLYHDLDVLQAGDMTMIGEKGINLSGGQKQRVSIARAAYSTKEIVILDDPLSALDPGVANKLFKECIRDFMRDRTRVLVTNQLNFLRLCDEISVLSAEVASDDVAEATDTPEDDSAKQTATSGRITEHGTFAELSGAGLNFADLLAKFNEGTQNRASSTGANRDSEAKEEGEEEDDIPEAKKADVLMQAEERNRGSVKFSQYSAYIKRGGGWCLFMIVVLLFVLSQGALVFNTQWISIWSQHARTGYANFTIVEVDMYANGTVVAEDAETPLAFYLIGYAFTAIMVAVLTYIRTVAISLLGLRASNTLHSALLSKVLGGKMSFFDTTPIGRIISRFSKDIYQLDLQVPQFFSFFMMTSISVLSTLTVITYTTPFFSVAILPLLVIYIMILQKFRPVTRDTKRLESISRSPVYAHFSETLGGLGTIRAYNETNTFQRVNALKVDHNINNWYHMKAADRWLAIRLELLGALVALLAAGLAVVAAYFGLLDAAQAGVSLTFATSVTTLLSFTIRSMAELESGMNSVERVLYYTHNVDQEAPREFRDPKKRPPKGWPHAGKLEITNLKMRYRPDTPLVLKGISFSVNAGERVGIVGRTGSGKSSTILCLLRLVEPEFDGNQGPIILDGVDICKIGLGALRKAISIVPQQSLLFSGTVRTNLDPFDKYSDKDIWEVLEKVNLSVLVAESPQKLETSVSEFGENFSQGQRQLLCMARALLEKSKLLLLDEATSSLDFESDVLIQKTIRSKSAFAECTLLVIAHRISTVLDGDKILVLDAGNVAEYGSPEELLANPNSQLSDMVKSH